MAIHRYFGLGIFVFLIILIIVRTSVLKKQGFEVVEFGKKDRKDLLIPPFVVFYIYIMVAATFNLPTIPGQILFESQIISWVGVGSGFLGILLIIWALLSFKTSFRIGLVENSTDGLITTGAFAISRNPIYLAFATILISEFLIYLSWILLLYIFLAIWAFRRQVLKEEAFLKEQYAEDFHQYCNHVRRWIGFRVEEKK